MSRQTKQSLFYVVLQAVIAVVVLWLAPANIPEWAKLVVAAFLGGIMGAELLIVAIHNALDVIDDGEY